MERRNWMYRISGKALNFVAVVALTVTAVATNRCCMWFLGQDEMPKDAKKLRKF